MVSLSRRRGIYIEEGFYLDMKREIRDDVEINVYFSLLKIKEKAMYLYT